MIRCKICDEPAYDAEGYPIGTVYVFQKVEGKIQLARQIVLHAPMFQIHSTCIEAVSERV